MAIIEGPEVVRRQRLASRRRFLLKYGIFIYYACLCILIVSLSLLRYYFGTKIIPKSISPYFQIKPGGFDAHDILPFTVPFLIVVLALSLAYFLAHRNPLSDLRPVPDWWQGRDVGSRLRSAIESVAIATGEKKLECAVMPSSLPNALAIISKHKPCFVITSGLLETDISERELTAIVAHESAHVASGDALYWASSSGLYFRFMMCAFFTLWLFLLLRVSLLSSVVEAVPVWSVIIFVILWLPPGPIAIYLDHNLRQQDDLFADALAVMITRDPEGVISAIKKIAGSDGNLELELFWKGFTHSPVKFRGGPRPSDAGKYFFVDPFDPERKRFLSEEADASLEYGPPPKRSLSIHGKGAFQIVADRPYKEKDLLLARLAALEEIRLGHSGQESISKIPADKWV